MKRSPAPQRKTPLAPGKPLERKTAWSVPTSGASMRHRNQGDRHHQQKRPTAARPAIPARVRAALTLRSEGKCEVGALGCTGLAVDPSHRIKTGMGGRKRDAAARHHVLSNILHACRMCHDQRLHAEPGAAYAAGWMLREHQNPAAEPVLYRGELRWLTDDGSVLTARPINEETS